MKNNDILFCIIFSNSMIMEEHVDAPSKLCRVCGGRINVHRVSYSCSQYEERLLKSFSISVLNDAALIHPQRFCMRCSAVMKRDTVAEAEN